MAQIPLDENATDEASRAAPGNDLQRAGDVEAGIVDIPDPPAAPASPPQAGPQQADGDARPATPPAPERPGLWDRFQLNYDDALYRGTLRGTGNLLQWRTIAEHPPSADAGLIQQYTYRHALDNWTQAQSDLIYGEIAPPAEGLLENAVALAGQIVGGAFTPEMLLSAPEALIAKAAAPVVRVAGRAIGRLAAAGIQGAVVNVATDPAVQAQAIMAGIQDGYDPTRTLMAAPTGFVMGAGLHLGAEGVRLGIKQTFGRFGRNRNGLGAEGEPLHDSQGDISDSQPATENPAPTEPPGTGNIQADVGAAVQAKRATGPAEQVADAQPGEALASGQSYRFKISDLATDPTTFQYKSGGDEQGVTQALKGVESFDPAKAGQIIVWQKGDGQLYVADGHQRTGLGRRLIDAGNEPADLGITGLLYREADGYTAQDVRSIAAAANLATGTGSAIDAAKVLRTRPDLIDSGTLPPNSQLVRDAKGLAALSDDAFGAVVNEVIPERYGALVGQRFKDPAMQDVAVRALHRADPANADEAAVLLERVATSAVEKDNAGRQGALFGEMFDQPNSTVIEEMKIVARALRRLKNDAALFRNAVRKADTLESAGSKIATEASSQASEAAARGAFLAEKAFDQKGPIRDKLTQLALDVKRGTRGVSEASSAFADVVRAQLGELPARSPSGTPGPEGDLFGGEKIAAMAVAKPDTKGFNRWFGGSKVVDKDGAPRVMFHASAEKFDKVDMSKGAQGAFWVTSDRAGAESGTVGASGSGHIHEMYVKIEKPAGWDEYDKFSLAELRGQGFDGVILPDKNGQFDAIVFKPSQVQFVKPAEFKVKPLTAEAPRRGTTPGDLLAMIENKASPEEISAHPVVRAAVRAQAAMKLGPTAAEIHDNPAYQANRQFEFTRPDGSIERVTGYEEGVQRLTEHAESYAGPDGVAPERRATIVIGPPAVGKSTLAEQIARNRRAAIVDVDDAKKALPEFQGGIGSSVVHEESSVLGGMVFENVARDGGNIVVPTVGADAGKVKQRAETLIKLGYTVDLINLAADPAEVYRRMVRRYLRTGRFINADYFNDVGDRPLNTYRTLQKEGLFSETANIEAREGEFRFVDGSPALAAEAQPVRSREGGDGRVREGGGSPTGRAEGGGGEAGAGGSAGAGRSGPTAAGNPDGIGTTGGVSRETSLQAMVTGLPGQQERPAVGVPAPSRTPNAPTSVPASPPLDVENLRQITERLNEALGMTTRQGRLSVKGPPGQKALGQYDTRRGVTRLREIDDFVVLSHEAGHHIEATMPDVKPMLRNNTFRKELAPLDYNPARGDISEGFAEFFRNYMTNPAYVQNKAPQFYAEFDKWLRGNHPGLSADLDEARAAYRTWQTAPSGAVIEAGMSSSFKPTGMRSVFRNVKDNALRTSIANAMSNFYTASFDQHNPIYKAVRALAQIHKDNTGKVMDLKAVDDPYKLRRLALDSFNSGHTDLMYGVHGYHEADPSSPSLREAIVQATGQPNAFGHWDEDALKKFNGYLISRRAVFEYGRLDRGEIAHAPTAESRGDHEVNIREIEAAHPEMKDAADKVYDWTRALLKKEYDAGLIGQSQFEAALQITDYVPFMRDMSDKKSGGVGSGGRGDLSRQSVIKRFNGSSRPIIPPLESLMKRAYDTNMLIKHNDVIKSLDRLAMSAGLGGGEIAERIPAKELRATHVDPVEAVRLAARDAGIDPVDADAMLKQVSDLLGDDASASIFRMGEINTKGEPIVFFWDGGQRQALRLADGDFGRSMYTALTAMPEAMRDLWVNLVGKPAAIFRTGVTTSPDFLFANYLRDQMSAFVLTDGYTPFVSGARGMADEIMQKDISRLYNMIGGISGGAQVAGLHEARINRDLGALAKQGWVAQRLTSFEGVASIAEVSETGTRLGVFRAAFERAKAEGLGDWEAATEAAFAARDLLDFGRRGSRMLVAQRLIPFFNASIQGLEKANRVLFEPAAKMLSGHILTVQDQAALGTSLKAWAKLSALAAMSMGLRALYRDSPTYDEASEYIRATHWVFRVPGTEKIITIPKPFELAIPINLAERAYEYFALNDPTALQKFTRGIWQIVSPPNILETPLIKIPFEVAANFNTFTNRPIVPDALKGLEPWLQYTAATSSLSKQLGRAINVSPAVLDHVIAGFGGSWGRGLLAGYDQLTGDKGDRGWDDMFLFRRFIKDDAKGSSSAREFWGLVSQASGTLEQKSLSYKAMVDQGRNAEAAQALSGMSDMERAYVTLNRSEFDADTKRINPLRRARDAVQAISTLRKEIVFNNVTPIDGSDKIVLRPDQRRELDDALAHVQMLEARNALIAIGQRGYQQRQIIDADPAYEVIAKSSPDVALELQARYAHSKVYDFKTVAENWPEAQKRLLADGSDANLGDLRAEARSGGYTLEGIATKKAKKKYVIPGRAAAN